MHTANEQAIGIAADIGSTTIAVSCFDLEVGKELASFSYTNPQTAYGADVITRIKKCVEQEGMTEQLSVLVKESLANHLKAHFGNHLYPISKIVYSANTTMLHILRGLSMQGLAKAPFKPATLDYTEEKASYVEALAEKAGVSSEKEKIQLIYPPGFSAFVGADILTGVEFLKMGQQATFDLLIDLGTNGEMVLLNCERGYATSTACGPVFDSALTGARYGSECIKTIANCIRRGLIDKNGLIAAPYFESGIMIDKDFIIKQENVRRFQLAKGAIYAGIECLMKRAEITEANISHVYISGGLGFYMNVRDAFTVNMIPERFKGRIIVSGNTSLEGAKKLLLADEAEKSAILKNYAAVRKRTESFELANFEPFQEKFVRAMNF